MGNCTGQGGRPINPRDKENIDANLEQAKAALFSKKLTIEE